MSVDIEQIKIVGKNKLVVLDTEGNIFQQNKNKGLQILNLNEKINEIAVEYGDVYALSAYGDYFSWEYDHINFELGLFPHKRVRDRSILTFSKGISIFAVTNGGNLITIIENSNIIDFKIPKEL